MRKIFSMPLKPSEAQSWTKKSLYGHGGTRLPSDVAKYVDYLKTNSGLVLDVGCGNGLVVRTLRRQSVNAVGIDIMPHKWDETPAAVADGFCLPFNDGVFSTVGCFAVLEHQTEPDKLLQEMARVLKPGGRMVISCPNMRGVFLFHPGHFVTHRGGLLQRIKNLAVYSKTLLISLFSKKDIPFEIMPPPDITRIPEKASDYNALCATNFITVKRFLRNHGFKIGYVSAGMDYSGGRIKQALIDVVDKIPILREMFGGMFIVAMKKG